MSQIAEAFVKLRPDTTTFRAEATAGIASGLGGVGGIGLRGAAGLGAITAAATLGTIAFKEMVVGAGEFEREMDVLQVVSGATADEMERIGDEAKALGADITLPGTSAGDAAVAMNELAKAGLTVTDTLGGARGALQLAAAGEIEVAEAAALAGSALNAFGLQGSEATHVADLLAGASIVAQGEVNDMALALQQSGAVSRQAGLSIEQTVGAIALLAKNGVLGSDAGTSLRTTLLRLIPTTKEATQFTKALGIEIDENRTLGEQLPEVVEQYRDSLSKLNPALQQQALTQIFGTDAIRAASILFREGADGLQEMTNAVDRNGAANELATAKTQGLLGTYDGLKSQLETTAIELGEALTPALTDFLEIVAGGVGVVNSLVGELKELAEVEIPGTDFGLGEIFREVAVQASPIGFAKRIKVAADAVHDFTTDAVDDMDSLRDSMTDLRTPDVLDRAELTKQVGRGGQEMGAELNTGFAQGVTATTSVALQAAQASLSQVIAQGKASVAQAVAQAQQNLAGLGAQLAADAGQVIDASGFQERIDTVSAQAQQAASARQQARQREAIELARKNLEVALANAPIERRIRRLQEELDQANQRSGRTDIARTLRDAREELQAAQARAVTIGDVDAGDRAARERFLRPFREGVTDAKDEMSRFNKEATIEGLQDKLDAQTDDIAENIGRLREALQDAREALIESQQSFATDQLVTSLRDAATAQKETVEQGIRDSIQAFNDGLITLPQLNRRLANLLRRPNGVDYKNAGKKLGTEFVRGFEETLKAIGIQAREVLAGPQDPGAGLRPGIVSPRDAVAAAALATQQARDRVQEAQLEAQESAAGSLQAIERAVTGQTTGSTKARPGAGVPNVVVPFNPRRGSGP